MTTRQTETTRSNSNMINLYDYQAEAIEQMHNGCILCGGVGSGKSITAIAYYHIQNRGQIKNKSYKPMMCPQDLYIITTARKRDTHEWESDLAPFLLSPNPELNHYKNKVVIDSWNNIKKYSEVKDAFFIFDEQRVVGWGAWSKAFVKIARSNKWILLSATPGDTWMDYMPVFIANGFFKNKSEFINRHVVYTRYGNFPKISRYLDEMKLERLRDSILVDMKFSRLTKSHHEKIYCEYDKDKYRSVMRDRWNPYTNEPIQQAAELCQCLRHVVNVDISRWERLADITEEHKRAIIFYNYNYELDMLREFCEVSGFEYGEWNGQKHEDIPTGDKWMYLVQYNAGAEGWNCITTDTIIFFSQNYSYKMMEQASGRINRLNTPYLDLYYYHLTSASNIDLAINKALIKKKKFNEKKFVEG